jgi:hypothetical protein
MGAAAEEMAPEALSAQVEPGGAQGAGTAVVRTAETVEVAAGWAQAEGVEAVVLPAPAARAGAVAPQVPGRLVAAALAEAAVVARKAVGPGAQRELTTAARTPSASISWTGEP